MGLSFSMMQAMYVSAQFTCMYPDLKSCACMHVLGKRRHMVYVHTKLRWVEELVKAPTPIIWYLYIIVFCILNQFLCTGHFLLPIYTMILVCAAIQNFVPLKIRYIVPVINPPWITVVVFFVCVCVCQCVSHGLCSKIGNH